MTTFIAMSSLPAGHAPLRQPLPVSGQLILQVSTLCRTPDPLLIGKRHLRSLQAIGIIYDDSTTVAEENRL